MLLQWIIKVSQKVQNENRCHHAYESFAYRTQCANPRLIFTIIWLQIGMHRLILPLHCWRTGSLNSGKEIVEKENYYPCLLQMMIWYICESVISGMLPPVGGGLFDHQLVVSCLLIWDPLPGLLQQKLHWIMYHFFCWHVPVAGIMSYASRKKVVGQWQIMPGISIPPE